MKNYRHILPLCFILCAHGCQSRAGSGAIGGAVVGGVVGGVAGGGTGVLIGAGAGAVGGAVIGAALDSSDKKNINPAIYQKYKRKQQLTVTDIIILSNENLSSAKIIHMIEHTNSKYCNLNRKEKSRMRRNGVHDDVINYMIETCDDADFS